MLKVLICLTFVLCGIQSFAQELQFKGGHSHNDYHQPHPLTDAWDNGMVSIEADVFLKDGILLVGHEEKELREDRTLDKLYLKPLCAYYNESEDKPSPVILMIDIKERGEACYTALKNLIARYQSTLTHYTNGKINKKDITIILSGDRPINMVKGEKDRYVFIDGRIPDLKNNEKSSLMPLISDDWKKFFTWDGKGNISDKERNKLQKFITDCHKQHKMIRFWGMPGCGDTGLAYWELLKKEGVDLIGTDCPSEYKRFEERKKW